MLLVELNLVHDALKKVIDFPIYFLNFAGVSLFYQHIIAKVMNDTNQRLRVTITHIDQIFVTMDVELIFLLLFILSYAFRPQSRQLYRKSTTISWQ